MKAYDPEGEIGPRFPLPDYVEIKEPLADKIVSEPTSEQREPAAVPIAAPAEEAYAPQEGYQQQQPADAYIEQPVF